jgi:glycosyltransferase involved in cell wall biosynthesis
MLCAHEPGLDPRIRWEAEGAATRFRTTVLGFNREDASLPAVEVRGGYTIHRVVRRDTGVSTFARHFFTAFRRHHPVAAGVLMLALVVPALLFELLSLALSGAYRALARLGLFSAVIEPLRGAWRTAVRHTRLGHLLGVQRRQFGPAAREFLQFIDAMAHKPDVVHCNDLDTLLVGIIAKQRYGCRVIYDAHEYYPESDPQGGWFDRTLFGRMERYLAHRADAVLTVNHLLAEVMRTEYGLRKVHALPNAEPVAGIVAEQRCSEMSRLAAGRVRFLFQGRFSARRGLDEIVDAWPGVTEKAVLFLRGPDNPARRALMTHCKNLGVLGKTVYFLDAVDEDSLIAAATEADVGLIPYKAEVKGYEFACPNKLSQYLHAGLMVLTNDLPYVREVLDDAGSGMHYSSANRETIVRAVDRLASDRDFLNRGRTNARNYARERFNWEAFSSTLYSLYIPES